MIEEIQFLIRNGPDKIAERYFMIQIRKLEKFYSLIINDMVLLILKHRPFTPVRNGKRKYITLVTLSTKYRLFLYYGQEFLYFCSSDSRNKCLSTVRVSDKSTSTYIGYYRGFVATEEKYTKHKNKTKIEVTKIKRILFNTCKNNINHTIVYMYYFHSLLLKFYWKFHLFHFDCWHVLI
jgi:hypothetical protein